MHGDHFYNYLCVDCSETKSELFERLPMSWCSIIQLVLYHTAHNTDNEGHILDEPDLLTVEETRLGKRAGGTEHVLQNRREGFYRWKEDICRIIDEWWDRLAPGRARTSSWQNSVSSILSANPNLFVSGQLLIKQSGWWALKVVQPPVPEGQQLDPSEVLPTPIRTDVDTQQLKTDLVKKLQGIDPKLLSEALFQSKRSIASLQRASRKGEKEESSRKRKDLRRRAEKKVEIVKEPALIAESEQQGETIREQFLLHQCGSIKTDNPYLKASLAFLRRRILLHGVLDYYSSLCRNSVPRTNRCLTQMPSSVITSLEGNHILNWVRMDWCMNLRMTILILTMMMYYKSN